MTRPLKHDNTVHKPTIQKKNIFRQVEVEPTRVICSNLLLRFRHEPPGHTRIKPRVLQHKLLTRSSNTPSSTQQAADYMESISDMVLFKLVRIKAQWSGATTQVLRDDQVTN